MTRDELRQALSFYRDLGVTDLYRVQIDSISDSMSHSIIEETLSLIHI